MQQHETSTTRSSGELGATPALSRKLTAQDSQGGTHDRPEARRDGAPGPSHQGPPLSYTQLLSRYNELEAQHEKCQLDLQQALQKAALCKERAKAWYSYALSLGSHDPKASASIEGDPHVCRDDGPAELVAGLRDVPDERGCQMPRRISCEQQSAAITSSQSTIIDAEEGTHTPAELIKVKLEPEMDEEPVFVSERNLERKRKQEDRISEPLRHIKREPVASQIFSQDPEPGNDISRKRLQLIKTMTSDLEIDGPTMQTPRKPRSGHREGVHADSGDAETSDRRREGTGASTLNGGARRRSTSKRSSTSVKVEHLDTEQSHVLRQISGNVPAKKRNTTRTPCARRRNAENHLAMLSEDGDLGPDNMKPARSKEHDVHNLDQMLRQPLSSKPVTPGKTSVKSAKRAAEGSRPSHLTPSTPSTFPIPKNHSRSEGISKVSTRLRNVDGDTSTAGDFHGAPNASPIRPDEEPLRIRNPDTLQLSDFKINPGYMGSKFAFTDTLRGRDQRQGLHTCTRPDCCGDAFRKVIELGGNAASGKADAQALEMYLGRDWSDVMSSLNPEKRKEMTMNAHVYVLSHENGKHKHAFERRSTPPGFWRTDMPTTQETADDRLKMVHLERQAVKERWLDATRGDGQWKFRDE